jgi:hypothetical protein
VFHAAGSTSCSTLQRPSSGQEATWLGLKGVFELGSRHDTLWHDSTRRGAFGAASRDLVMVKCDDNDDDGDESAAHQ